MSSVFTGSQKCSVVPAVHSGEKYTICGKEKQPEDFLLSAEQYEKGTVDNFNKSGYSKSNNLSVLIYPTCVTDLPETIELKRED